MDHDTLLQKWLSDELTSEELKAFEALEDATFYKDIIKDAERFKVGRFSEMADFDTFKQRIGPTEDTGKVRKLFSTAPLLRIAGVLILLVGLSYLFLKESNVAVQTVAAQKTTIELPDASKVVLNALTEVNYDKDNWDTKREISLEGEAFFDVAKGAKFDVLTSQGTVSVLGTEFNVKQRGDYFEVACFEGTVRVVSKGVTKILNVGDKFTSLKGETVFGEHGDNKPQWTENTSYFERIPVGEVFAELERQYDIEIMLQDIDTDQLFTGGFSHDHLENALFAVSEPLELDFEILKPGRVRLSTRGK